MCNKEFTHKYNDTHRINMHNNSSLHKKHANEQSKQPIMDFMSQIVMIRAELE